MQRVLRLARWVEVLFAVISILFSAGLPISTTPGEAAQRASLIIGALLALWFAWRLPRGNLSAQVGAPLLAVVTSAPALTGIILGGLTGSGAPPSQLGRVAAGAWVGTQLVILACCLFTPQWRHLFTAERSLDDHLEHTA